MADDFEKNRNQPGQSSGQPQSGQHGQSGQTGQQSGQPGQAGQQKNPQDPTKKNLSEGGQDVDDEQDNKPGQRRAS